MSTTYKQEQPALAPFTLAGRRVAITGGTSGLGKALVRELVDRWARVAFVARGQEGIDTTLRDLPEAYGIQGDVSRKEDVYPIALQVAAVLGGVDILIHNASSLGPAPLAPLADTDCEDLEKALATNLLAPFRLTKALLGSLASAAREGRGGLIVTISSDAAGNAYPNWGAYSASKAALLHMSRIWNEELRPSGIAVISFDPGDMDTPLHAAAVPDADRSVLRNPADAARELADLMEGVLGRQQAELLEAVQ